jgi:hypothetical protein
MSEMVSQPEMKMVAGRERQLDETYHVLATSHQSFVDDLGGVITTGVNVHTLLHN